MAEDSVGKRVEEAPVPKTFVEYLKSWGPGIVVVLTWLGAGDIVDCAVAGANYGYALMWALALSLIVRWAVVSIMAKYHLANVHGESLMQGFLRIGKWLVAFLGIVSVLFGHYYNSYMIKGIGAAWYKMTGIGTEWMWATLWVIVGLAITYKGKYDYLEKAMKVLLGVLAVCFIGTGIWVRPSGVEILKGTFGFAVPSQIGPFGALLVVASLIGSIGGSIANLTYPYFCDGRRWKGPQYVKVQRFDLLLSIIVVIILDLSIWVTGAKLAHPRGLIIRNIDDIAEILALALGDLGRYVLYLGVFAATFTSLMGFGVGMARVGIDAWHTINPERKARYGRYDRDPWYTYLTILIIITPMIWLFLPYGFIELVIIINAIAVLLLPLLTISIWYITSREDLMGKYKNKWYEHALLAIVTALSLWASYNTIVSLIG